MKYVHYLLAKKKPSKPLITILGRNADAHNLSSGHLMDVRIFKSTARVQSKIPFVPNPSLYRVVKYCTPHPLNINSGLPLFSLL